MRVGRERAEITEAERRYAERYRTPRVNARGSSWVITDDRVPGPG